MGTFASSLYEFTYKKSLCLAFASLLLIASSWSLRNEIRMSCDLIWNQVQFKIDHEGKGAALKVLDLPYSVTPEEVTIKWRRLSREFHPDKIRDPALKVKANEKFIEIQMAYEHIQGVNRKLGVGLRKDRLKNSYEDL